MGCEARALDLPKSDIYLPPPTMFKKKKGDIHLSIVLRGKRPPHLPVVCLQESVQVRES